MHNDGTVRTRFMAQASWGVVWVVMVLSACNLTPVDNITQTVTEFGDFDRSEQGDFISLKLKSCR